MNARAYITDDFTTRGVAVYLVEKLPDGRTALGEPVEIVMRPLDGPPATSVTESPTLRLPEDVARALLDALAAHFGGTSDVLTLRKDYMAERARVDKLIGHLTGRDTDGR